MDRSREVDPVGHARERAGDGFLFRTAALKRRRILVFEVTGELGAVPGVRRRRRGAGLPRSAARSESNPLRCARVRVG
jgi:hypothetical protein